MNRLIVALSFQFSLALSLAQLTGQTSISTNKVNVYDVISGSTSGEMQVKIQSAVNLPLV